MPKTAPVSVRLDPALDQRLEQIAVSLDRSKSWVITQAVEEFVAVREWQLEAIEEGIRDAEAGRVVDHQDVVEWVMSWGTPDEKPMPLAKPR